MRRAQGRWAQLPDCRNLFSRSDCFTSFCTLIVFTLKHPLFFVPKCLNSFSAALALSVVCGAAWADNQYIYDPTGRLVEVVASDGTSAQYSYDSAGNITAINRFTSTALSISTFSPNQGSADTIVKIWGSGFKTTATQNTVKFNGVAATVTAATATMLTVTVPTSATTGKISVTTSSGTATSAGTFTVAANVPPTITNFSPSSGPVGTTITINGSGFDANIANNKVQIGGHFVNVIAASSSQLQVAVSNDTFTGPIAVATTKGSATSAQNFVVLSSGYTQTDIAVSGQLVPSATTQSIAINTLNKIGVYTFGGSAGQHFSLALTNVGMVGLVYLVSPNGAVLGSWSLTNNTVIDVPALSVTGTYSIVFAPTSTGSLSLGFNADATGILTAGSASTNLTLATGQNGNLSFSGVVGQRLALSISGLTITGSSVGVQIYVLGSDGSALTNCGQYKQSVSYLSCDIPQLPATGTFTVIIDPQQLITASLTLSLSMDVVGTVAANSITNVSLGAGQIASYDFQGTAGQTVGVGLGNIVTTPSGSLPLNIRVWAPNGSLMLDCGGSSGNISCAELTLPSTGSYRFVFNSYGGYSSATTFYLSSDKTGTLVANGATQNISAQIGQGARYNFSVTAGQRYSMHLTGAPSNAHTYVSIYKSDGSQVTSQDTNGYSELILDFQALTTDTYSVLVSSAGYVTPPISYNLALLQNVSGTLSIGGAPTSVSLVSAQNANYTFSGIAGQRLGIGVSGVSLTPYDGYGRVYVSVLAPDGSYLSMICSLITGGSSFNCDVSSPLSSTGTYTVLINPSGNYAASLVVSIATDVTGTLTVDGVSHVSLTPSQNAVFTFSGTAGQMLGLGASNVVAGPNSGGYEFRLSAPDGSLILYTGAAPPNGMGSGPITLPSSGSYQLLVRAMSGNTGSLDLLLSSPVTGTLPVNGAVNTFATTRNGQFAKYTFAGTAGQSYSISLSGDTYSGSTKIIVLNPSGSQIYGSSLYYSGSGTASTGTMNLGSLGATGNYSVLVVPTYGDGQIGIKITQP